MISINDAIAPANGLIMALLRSPLHFVASKGLMIVSWSGRVSGRSFSIPVGYQQHGEALVVLISKRTEKSWWKNFSAPWPASLTLRGKRRSATGEVVPVGSPEFFQFCEQTLEQLPWMGSQFGGIQYQKGSGLDEAQRRVLCECVGAVRFELEN